MVRIHAGEPYRFGYKLAVPSCLTAALCATSVIPNNSKVFAGADLSGWRGGFAGVRAQPPGFSPDPKFSLANSPVSPVDRLRLLTAPSSKGAHIGRGRQQTKAVNRKNRGLIGIPGRPRRRFQTGRPLRKLRRPPGDAVGCPARRTQR